MPDAKLTVTEAETLEIMLDNAARHMALVCKSGSWSYVWGRHFEAVSDMWFGFYDLVPDEYGAQVQ